MLVILVVKLLFIGATSSFPIKLEIVIKTPKKNSLPLQKIIRNEYF